MLGALFGEVPGLTPSKDPAEEVRLAGIVQNFTLFAAAAPGAMLGPLFGEVPGVMPSRDPAEEVRPAGIAQNFTPKDFVFFSRDCRDLSKAACGWISRNGTLSALPLGCGEDSATFAANAANAETSCSIISTGGTAVTEHAASAASAAALAAATGARMAAAVAIATAAAAAVVAGAKSAAFAAP